ncbi:MAG: hypothetical protein IPJ65_26605 [Archangiaceae bacterium]|nr:hypothetical protein [Archangiaceae bacterium]
MKRAWLLLLSSCLLDPGSVIKNVELTVTAYDLPVGGKLHLTTVDADQRTREKTAYISEGQMNVLYEQGALAQGALTVGAEVFDADGTLVACGAGRAVVGEDKEVIVGLSSVSMSALNCGACGHRCETDQAVGQCVAGQCAAWECPIGLIAESDGGCTMPPPPDAGPVDAGGIDAGEEDAGFDAGPSCVPAAEDSQGTCTDGVDNNCDLRTDCADPGCGALKRACVLDAGCIAQGVQTFDCASKSWGVCVTNPSAEDSVDTCSDNIDNDCDGKTDCLDTGCQNIKQPCPGGVCAAGLRLWNCNTHLLGLCLPYIPLLAENSALTCGNSLDDDCDGKTDCLDAQCRGRQCASGRICCGDGGCATSCP